MKNTEDLEAGQLLNEDFFPWLLLATFACYTIGSWGEMVGQGVLFRSIYLETMKEGTTEYKRCR